MEPPRRATVPVLPVPMRADRAAVELPGVRSRSRARALWEGGGMHLNGAPAEPSRWVREGDVLERLADEEPPPEFDHPLRVLFADDDVAVVVKPAGLETSGAGRRTVENALPGNLGPSAAADALPVPRAAHRLDRRTSGLLLVGRSRAGLAGLGRQLEERLVEKRYRALAGGSLEGGGTCAEPIEGAAATSVWAAVERTPSVTTRWITTVDVRPVTGAQAPDRRHLAALGAPVLGDDLHGEGPVLRSQGLFLCAVEVAFAHPRTGEALRFELEEPARFAALRRREERRWRRLAGEGA